MLAETRRLPSIVATVLGYESMHTSQDGLRYLAWIMDIQEAQNSGEISSSEEFADRCARDTCVRRRKLAES